MTDTERLEWVAGHLYDNSIECNNNGEYISVIGYEENDTLETVIGEPKSTYLEALRNAIDKAMDGEG